MPPIIALFFGLIAGGCAYHSTRESTSATMNSNGNTYKASGTCSSNSEVSNKTEKLLKGICGGRGYKITQKNTDALKCINGEYNSNIDFFCM